jgi:hypothetical protein
VTLTKTEPSSSLIATRLAAKSIITDLQIDDYNSQSSRQARFVEQQEADKKQELIDLSIQHQILSPFTAFIGVETRTEQEKASASEIILREVPIEIRANDSSSDDDANSPRHVAFRRKQMSTSSDDEECDDEIDEEDFDDEEDCDDESIGSSVRLTSCLRNSSAKVGLVRCASRRRSRSRSPQRRRATRSNKVIAIECDTTSESSTSRSRSRSCSHRERSSIEDQIENDITPSDTIRQIIGLQNYSGFWSMNNLEQIILLLQRNSTSKDVDLKKILHDYKEKDNDIILSMIIMFIFMKYFLNDQALWKPIIKKCAKALENQLGKKEYNDITDKIKPIV